MIKLALHWQILIAMVLGAVIGAALNATSGDFTTTAPARVSGGSHQLHGMDSKVAVPRGFVWVKDSPSETLIQFHAFQGPGELPKSLDKAGPGQTFTTRRIVIRGPVKEKDQAKSQQAEDAAWPPLPRQENPAAKIERVEEQTVGKLKSADPVAYVLFQQHGRSKSRTLGDLAKLGGDLFLRMLKMVSIPLIITSLITGITGLGRAERLGKMFGRTLLYYLCTSMIAIFIGLAMVNLIQPGVDSDKQPDAEQVRQVEKQPEGKGLSTVLFEQVENMIPPNPIHAAANGKFLSVIAFSILFGVCTILVGGRTGELLSGLFEAAFEVMMKMTMLIISLAPIGVGLLMLSATANQGLAVFVTLGWYMITVACRLFIHAVIVLPMIVHFVARRNPWDFAKAMSPALLTAFGSASSNGTLPLTMTSVEQRAGVSNRVGSFVLPLGATINMDGTALYEVVAVLFIAQFSGLDLTMVQQVIIAFTALLASVGAAGIPHAGLVMMVIILQSVGLPTESQGLIIAVDRVLDMLRTSVNVWSDSCGCAVVARFEAEGAK